MTVWIAVECPDCHSTDITKHGSPLKTKQRYLCQNQGACAGPLSLTIPILAEKSSQAANRRDESE
jgi:hypothetical protein